MKAVWSKLLCRRGSISIITIGLFIVLLSTALVLTNISSIYLAKRSLNLAIEAAVQRGMKNLDAEIYYSGEYNLTQLLQNSLGRPESDPGIPIDCEAGGRDLEQVLQEWQERGSSISRSNVEQISVTKFQCDGYQIFAEVAANAYLPIPIPFIDFDHVRIQSYAGAIGERAETNNYSGFDIG